MTAGLQVHCRAGMVLRKTHQVRFDEITNAPTRSTTLAESQRDPFQLTNVTSDTVLERNTGKASWCKTTTRHG